MLDIDLIEQCIIDASKEKRHKPAIQEALENKHYYAERLLELLKTNSYEFREYDTMIIADGATGKERTIVCPKFVYDQILHHLLSSQLAPIVMKSLYTHSYGSVKGRSPHDGMKHMKKWIQSYGNKRIYVFKCDIHHYYDSIDHTILKRQLQKKISDDRYLDLVFRLIDSFSSEPGKGIPKGFYISQWFSHLYLTELDHFIKEQLHVKHYMRYVDDMVLLDTNKKRLRKNAEAIVKFLDEKLNLELKDNYQLYRFVDKDDKNGRDIDFMGFRFFRNKTTLRKRSLRSARRKANHLDKKRRGYNEGTSQGVTVHDAQSMLSYCGMLKHTDTYNYYQENIKPKVNKRRLRKKVSNHQKKLNRQSTK